MNWHDAFNASDKVKCSCEWPHVLRTGSQALGLVVDIDLCCLVEEVERLSGKSFHRTTHTEPVFVWDCCERTMDEDGKLSEERGLPPPFMVERAAKSGITIKNLEEHRQHEASRT